MPAETPAFEVVRPDGHRYQVWADGRIAGFDDDDLIVLNRIPALMNRAAEAYSQKRTQHV